MLACGDEPLPRDPPMDLDPRRASRELKQPPPAPRQVRANAAPTLLLGDFYGPMSREAALELIDPLLEREVMLERRVESRGGCPGYHEEQLRVRRWQYAQNTGDLLLEFLNERLVYVSFIPDRYQSFHAELARRGMQVRIDGTPTFRNAATRVVSLHVGLGSGFNFSDDRMARELRETVNACHFEYAKSDRTRQRKR